MVIMKWNPYVEEWFMFDEKGREMYRFRDCANINRLYRGLDKTKANYYPQEPLEPMRQEGVL